MVFAGIVTHDKLSPEFFSWCLFFNSRHMNCKLNYCTVVSFISFKFYIVVYSPIISNAVLQANAICWFSHAMESVI